MGGQQLLSSGSPVGVGLDVVEEEEGQALGLDLSGDLQAAGPHCPAMINA